MIWTDIVLCVLVLNILVSVCIMVTNFFKYRHQWTSKTIDHWYAQFMWKIFGISICIEWLVREHPLGYSFVFMAAASIASLIGNLKQHKWEGDGNE